MGIGHRNDETGERWGGEKFQEWAMSGALAHRQENVGAESSPGWITEEQTYCDRRGGKIRNFYFIL